MVKSAKRSVRSKLKKVPIGLANVELLGELGKSILSRPMGGEASLDGLINKWSWGMETAVWTAHIGCQTVVVNV